MSGDLTDALPIPSKSACFEASAVESKAGVRRPPVKRINGRVDGSDKFEDKASMACCEKRVKKVCLIDLHWLASLVKKEGVS